MEKSITELVRELLKKNERAAVDYSSIEVQDECGNQFIFLFSSTGYNEYTQYICRCQSDLFEKPVSFYMTTVHDSIIYYDVTYDSDALKHEEILRHAIELALQD